MAGSHEVRGSIPLGSTTNITQKRSLFLGFLFVLARTNRGRIHTMDKAQQILATLHDQKVNRVKRGFYWENQIAFAYNSNKIEGSKLTEDQTRSIFETQTISGGPSPVDDIIETENHFRVFDYMLETLKEPLSASLMCEYHKILKQGTSDDLKNPRFVVGGWKTEPNRIAGKQTTLPTDVPKHIEKLLSAYDQRSETSYENIASFHYLFESIHPFQDGNGRVGRVLAFRECLAHDLVPFIVIDSAKIRYYDALQRSEEDPSVLVGFLEEMADLYYEEYQSLIPQYLLIDGSDKDLGDLSS